VSPTSAKSVTAKSVTKVPTVDLIRLAAIDLFFEHGYEATSLREVASRVGIQVGSLYNHLSSKEGLLYELMTKIIEDLLTELDARLADVEDVGDRLRVAIEVHVFFHTARAREVFIGNSELRSLSPAHRRTVVKLRDAYESRFVEIIERGQKEGRFATTDPKLAAWAILAIGTSTSGWFRPGGRLQLGDIADTYTELVLHGLELRR